MCGMIPTAELATGNELMGSVGGTGLIEWEAPHPFVSGGTAIRPGGHPRDDASPPGSRW